MIKKLVRRQEGFTLLELIVVVAVIGILAAIIVPQVTDIQDDAKENSVRANLSNIQTSLEKYKIKEGDGQYPDNLTTAGVSVDTNEYNYSTTDNTGYVVYSEIELDDTNTETTADYLFINSQSAGVKEWKNKSDTPDETDETE